MNLLTLALSVTLSLLVMLAYACWSLWTDMRFWRTEAGQMGKYIEQVEKENDNLLRNHCPYCKYPMDLVCGDCGRTYDEAESERQDD